MSKHTTDYLAVFRGNRFNGNFGISHRLNCNSSNVIYLISCLKCQKQYVNETTQSIKARFHGQSPDVRLNKDAPVGEHFSSQGHYINDLKYLPSNKFLTKRMMNLAN